MEHVIITTFFLTTSACFMDHAINTAFLVTTFARSIHHAISATFSGDFCTFHGACDQ
jgi:hypothetical protein